MENNEIKRFLIRRDTKKFWIQYDPVLESLEGAYELDSDKMKLGNGKDKYSELPYYIKEKRK